MDSSTGTAERVPSSSTKSYLAKLGSGVLTVLSTLKDQSGLPLNVFGRTYLLAPLSQAASSASESYGPLCAMVADLGLSAASIIIEDLAKPRPAAQGQSESADEYIQRLKQWQAPPGSEAATTMEDLAAIFLPGLVSALVLGQCCINGGSSVEHACTVSSLTNAGTKQVLSHISKPRVGITNEGERVEAIILVNPRAGDASDDQDAESLGADRVEEQ